MKGTIMEIKTEINAKIDSTKKFVNDHKVAFAYGAGLVVGVTGMAIGIKQMNALVLTHNNLNHLQNGGVIAYETKLGTILAWVKPDSIDIPIT
ncbi:gp047 [Rhodococcus phage ReqiPoco6]|uniref:Gp047 n=1 Tax=Rhodococcus phage ReqiPoco6 TaxID=691964 RepID=D4P7R5_9CAUD|nr:gp047 [Rhodococcus phage ReqiPoco6]ADD81045.1 gp047 [Rhodococcus phage ReqiPoco6]